MLDFRKEKIVKRGLCFCGNTKEYEVIIVESDIRYGSGDYEDPPEIAEDIDCHCYYLWFDVPASRDRFFSGGGVFLSLDEAIVAVEKENYFSHWIF